MSKLRILFVDAAVEMSISDSARGYLGALRRQGHDVYHFRTSARMAFAQTAFLHGPRPELGQEPELIARTASEMMVVEALRHRADLVVVSSGLGLHQDGLELLNRAKFPVALILTESPYDDENQMRCARHAGHVFTNDSYSARRHGWAYLPSAYDPEYHHLFPYEADEACDVLFVGTGWPERQKLLEAIDWTGIRLRILGIWPTLTPDSPLWPYYTQVIVTNDETARLYSSAKIAINSHRHHPKAQSLNPRGYELGACGVFQVSDYRSELEDVYGGSVPVYDSPATLERIIRETLADDRRRTMRADDQRRWVTTGRHTFDHRAEAMMDRITSAVPV